MRKVLISGVLIIAVMVFATWAIDMSEVRVQIGSGSSSSAAGNTVANEKGVIGPDADIEGIVIINGELSIDGVKIAKGVTEYVSRKTKKVYLIKWNKKGELVDVTEKP